MRKITFLLLNVFLTLSFVSAEVFDNLYVVGNACDTDRNDNVFQVSETGEYTISINLNTKAGNIDEETPDLSQLYLIGGATAAGWENTSAIKMTWMEEGIFFWQGELAPALSGNDTHSFKFLNELGTWNKTINPVSNASFVAGREYDLQFRPLESSPRDYKFRITAAGTYYMLVNLNTMKITIDYAEPDLRELYIVGSATEAGWDADNAFAMTEVEEGIHTWTGNLSAAGEGEFIFLNKKGVESKTINPLNGNLDFAINTEYNLNFRPMESSPGDFKFRVTETGRYTIDVNLNDMTIIIEAGRTVGINDAEMNDFCTVNVSDKTISLQAENNVSIKTAGIFDMTGRCLNVVSNIQNSVVLAENPVPGIYIVKINCENKEFVQKIIIK